MALLLYLLLLQTAKGLGAATTRRVDRRTPSSEDLMLPPELPRGRKCRRSHTDPIRSAQRSFGQWCFRQWRRWRWGYPAFAWQWFQCAGFNVGRFPAGGSGRSAAEAEQWTGARIALCSAAAGGPPWRRYAAETQKAGPCAAKDPQILNHELWWAKGGSKERSRPQLEGS